jgi:iron complex outermembrane receptor protein
LEWYNKYTSDLIWEYDVPATKYLYNKMTANVGEISNTGIELTLSYDLLSRKTFNWSTGFTLAHNKNKIESLSDEFFKIDYVLTGTAAIGAGQTGGSAQIIKEGYPIGTFYTLKFQGFSDDGKSLFLNKDGEITASPVAPDDYYICGDAQPKLNYSWINSLTWRRFNMDLLFRGVAGHSVLNSTLAKLTYSSRVSHYNQPQYVLESNQPFNDIRSHFTSDRYIQRADFFRLENISLGYTLPMNNNYVKHANFYLTVSNAFILTDYKGIDPEIDMGGIEPGIDNNNMYPKTRSYQVGVKLNF